MSERQNVSYKSHRPGSRKGFVHKAFDEKGPEAALRAGRQRQLKATTLKSWFSTWARKA